MRIWEGSVFVDDSNVELTATTSLPTEAIIAKFTDGQKGFVHAETGQVVVFNTESDSCT